MFAEIYFLSKDGKKIGIDKSQLNQLKMILRK